MFTQLMESTTAQVKTNRSLSLTLAIVIHTVLMLWLLLWPLLAPETLSAQLQNLTFLITPPPPPAPPRAPNARGKRAIERPIQESTIRVPKEIPRRIEIVVDEAPLQLPVDSVARLTEGIPGGVQRGVPDGILGARLNPFAIPPAMLLQRTSNNTVQRVQVGGGIQQARLISQLKPQYPPLAKQARVQGAVLLEAVISKEGSVINLKVISGHPLLIPAALDAVKQWKYKPTLLNSEPVEVLTSITVNFSLGG